MWFWGDEGQELWTTGLRGFPFSRMMVGIPVKFIEPKMTTDVSARMESKNHFVKFFIEK